jgi:hypothetical protein
MSVADAVDRATRDLEADRALVPPHLFEGVRDHILLGRPTGSFLTAVFANDLHDAAVLADPISLAGLPDLVRFLHANAPLRSCGSREDVARWRRLGGIAGGAQLKKDGVEG